MGKHILTFLLVGFVTLSANADSFAVPDKSKNNLPTQTDFYNGCMKIHHLNYVPNAGESQASVDKKIAASKAEAEKICQCTAPREYALMKEVIGNDIDAFNARMQADKNFAIAATTTIKEKTSQIDKECAIK